MPGRCQEQVEYMQRVLTSEVNGYRTVELQACEQVLKERHQYALELGRLQSMVLQEEGVASNQVQGVRKEVVHVEAACAQRVLHLESQEQDSVHNAAAMKLRLTHLNNELSEMARLKRSVNTVDHEATHDLELECKAMGQHELYWYGVAQKNQELAVHQMVQAEEQKEQSLKELDWFQHELDHARANKEAMFDRSQVFGDPEKDSRYESLRGRRPWSYDRQVSGRQNSSEGQRPSGRNDPRVPKRTVSPGGQRPLGSGLRGDERQENRARNHDESRWTFVEAPLTQSSTSANVPKMDRAQISCPLGGQSL